MAITILDYVKSVIGDKPSYYAEDFDRCGVDMFGGCERCETTIAAYNAYPSRWGYWRCAECIGSTGYATIREFTSQGLGDYSCPACGAPGHVIEVEGGTACSLTCRQCGTSWTHLG
jgi:hypothetical protein